MKTPALIIAALWFSSPATAMETEWVEVAPDVSLRLVSADLVTPEGTVWMGLEVDMPETTKTYWRVPGESGLPLVVDTAGSQDIGSLTIAWPYPKRETADGYLDHAFYGRVLIPFEVAMEGERPRLVADITMGVCSDICIPVTASFELSPALDTPDGANGLRIRQALATVPLPHEGDGLLGAATFDADRGAIVVELDDPDFDPASMIAEIAGSSLLFGEPELSKDRQSLSFPLLGRVDHRPLEEGQARFTFNTADGPFEIVRQLTGATR